MDYHFRNWYIREDMYEAILRYEDHRIKPGDFLTAVICNDLCGAWGSADDENLANLPAFVAYFYNEAPSECWGSRERMLAWLRPADETEAA